jgi:hypothetical protein
MRTYYLFCATWDIRHTKVAVKLDLGRDIAQAVSRRVRTQVRSCGICGGHSGTEEGFLLVILFPLPILIPSTVPHQHLSSIAGTIRQLLAYVPSGLSLTPNQRN